MQADPRVQVTEFPDSEDELIRLAQNGDREAFCELVRRFRVGVIDVVYRMCGNSDVAEDAAQQTFFPPGAAWGASRPQTSFRSWLYRIAINAAVDILRREQPAVDIELLPLAAPAMACRRRSSAVSALSGCARRCLRCRKREGRC